MIDNCVQYVAPIITEQSSIPEESNNQTKSTYSRLKIYLQNADVAHF